MSITRGKIVAPIESRVTMTAMIMKILRMRVCIHLISQLVFRFYNLLFM